MKLYNTLSRKIEEFKPLNDKKVNMFVCGPTVYDYSHLGHAKTYIQLDVLARVLRQQDYDVFYLQNITDIDDKIIARAQESNTGWEDLRSEYETKYLEDMESLGNTAVTKYARATDYIPDIIRQIQTLIEKGHAYTIDDGIYFEIATFPDYGKLSGRKEVKENDAQTRIDQSDQKKGWNDFCLWKFFKPGEPVWEAPFGKGRPGWHIEDTAITEHFFGPQYDIHGGAVDLIFPHHEAELAQMESSSGKVPFVGHWVHTGFLNIDDAKMSKSLGNFYTIRDVIDKGYDPMAIRLWMLQAHYRSSMNFTWENLDGANNRLKVYQAMAALRWQPKSGLNDASTVVLKQVPAQLTEILSDDLATSRALAYISDIATQLETLLLDQDETNQFNNVADFIAMLEFIDKVFGLNLMDIGDISDDQKQSMTARDKARAAKDWELSDTLRDELKNQRIGLRDTDHGQIWFRI